MTRAITLVLFAFAAVNLLPAGDSDVVFRSDVSLVRVDAQVLDRDNRTITGLRAEDFVLRDDGRTQQIRNFTREEMPVDILFLLDVSASMKPHVERIANASHDALRVLGKDDRIAIMVFDRSTRVRMSFRSSQDDVRKEFDKLLRQETFRGGTDITRGMLDAADYVKRNARRGVRRAIVILTDDQTELERDEERVGRALVNADAVMSALLAPDAMQNRQYGGMGQPGGSRGGSYPGGSRRGGGGIGGLGGVIIGMPGGGSGGRYPGGGGGGGYPRGGGGQAGPRTHTAGTAEIARDSGGDSLPVDDASALETTLSRIRQRYALHFLSPADARPGQERTISVELADSARRRYPDAEVRFRKLYRAPEGAGGTVAANAAPAPVSTEPAIVTQPSTTKRRAAVDEPSGSRGASAEAETPAATDPPPTGGWRKAKPDEK